MVMAYDKQMYQYVLEIEMMFLMRYNIMVHDKFNNMTIMDLQWYVTYLTNKIEEESKHNDGNKLLKSLAAIRDILIFMNLPKTR